MTRQEVIDWWRKNEPTKWQNTSDEDLYQQVKKKFNIPDENVVQETKEPLNTKAAIQDFDTSPGLVSRLMTTGLSEAFADEGGLGWSADFWKETYNKSLAGTMFKAIHGKEKYQDAEYDENWIEGAAQFFLGMASPVEIATFAGAGLLGGVAKKGITSLATKAMGLGIKKSTETKVGEYAGRVMLTKMLGGAAELGVSGSAYAAAHGAVAEAGNQRAMGAESLDMSKVFMTGADTFVKSLPLFAITGGLVKGLMGTGHSYAKWYAEKEATFANKAAKVAFHPTTQVVTEAGLFTTLPSVLPEILGGHEDSPSIGSDDWWHEFGKNIGIMGGLKVFNKFASNKIENSDVLDIILTEFDIKARANKSSLDAKENLANTLKTVPRELADAIIQERIINSFSGKDKTHMKKNFKKVKDILKKMEDEKYVEKWKNGDEKITKEVGEAAQALSEIQLIGKGTIHEILSKEEKVEQHFKKIHGRSHKIDKDGKSPELENFKNQLKTWSDIQQETLNSFNVASRGDMSNPNTTQVPANRQKQLVDPESRKVTDKREVEVNKLVDKIAFELKKTPKEIKEDPQFQTGLVDQKGNPILSQDKLQKTYNNILKGKPDSPEAKLHTSRIKTREKVSSIEMGGRRAADKGGFGKSGGIDIIDYLKSQLKEGTDHYIDALHGFERFMTLYNSQPKAYKRMVDYFKWLKGKGLKITDASSRLTELYIKERGWTGKENRNKRLYLFDAQSKFYGTGEGGMLQKRKDGFSYEYMDGRTVSIVGVDRAGKKAGTGKVGVAEPKEYKKFSERKKGIFEGIIGTIKKGVQKVKNLFISDGEIRISKKGTKKTKVETADAAIDMLYEFGARGIDILERLKIKDIDWNNGEIRILQSGEGKTKSGIDRLNIPLRDVIPELWDKLVKVRGGRDKNSSENLFTTTDGKTLSGNLLNKILEQILPEDIKLIGKKGKIQIQDFRRMIESDASGSKFIDFVDMQLVAHKGNIRQRYIHKDDVALWREWREYRKGLGEEPITTKTPKPKQRVEAGAEPGRVIFRTKGDIVKRDAFIEKVMKLNKLTEEQLRVVGLDKGVLGEFAEGVIKLQKGQWQPSDFYHENMHRLKALAKSTGDKKMLKLIERGESLAKNTKAFKEWKKKPGNKNRDMEEFFSDVVGGKASRLEFSKGLYNKISQFVKQLVSSVKVKLGVGNFNDLSRYFAKKVQKGFETEGVTFAKEPVKYKTSEIKESLVTESQLSEAKSILSQFYKRQGIKTAGDKNEIRKYVARASGLTEEFRLSGEVSSFQLNAFTSMLQSLDKNVAKRLPSKVKWFKQWSNVEKLRIERNVTENSQREILLNYGVKDGNIFKASQKQLDVYTGLLNEMREYNKRNNNWIDDLIKDNNVPENLKTQFKKVNELKRLGMPLHVVLESMGLKPLSKRLLTHSTAEVDHIGKGIVTFQENAKAIVGKGTFEKVKEHLFLLDKKRYIELKEDGLLTKKQERFINSALDADWKPRKIGGKYSPNAQLVIEYQKMTKYYKEMFHDVLKQVMSEAEYEKFVKDGSAKMIEDGFYVSRVLTQDFKNLIYNPKSKNFQKTIDRNALKIAERMAVNIHGKKPTKEQIANYMADATIVAESELQNAFHFNPGKYSTNFMKERGPKMKEQYRADNGKLVKTYETSYDATVAAYANGFSKFLANVEFFPEHVNLTGFKFKGLKTQIEKLKQLDPNLGEWVNEKVNDHLGIRQGAEPYKRTTQFIRRYTGVLAKLQLSFPLSGLKNFLLGSTQTMLAFRMRDFFWGIAHTFNRDNRNMIKSMGATELGMRHFTETKTQKAIDKYIFKFGLMKPSENINRYISVLASKNEQLHLHRMIKNNPKTSGAYKKAYRKLNKFYQLSDVEINRLKKYGLEGIEGHEFKNAFEKGVAKRQLDVLYQKMNTLAHINTQGASIDLFMPEWAGKPLAKSALLYKRMAYAASVNTLRNLGISLKNGNIIPSIMFGLGTYVGGSTLLYLYDQILGQPMPKEKSEWWNQFKTILWKGEFMGLFSEFLSPFDTNGMGQSMYPAITNHVALLVNTLQTLPVVGKGDKFWIGGTPGISGGKLYSQAMHDLAKGSMGLYNNVSKMVERGMLAKDSYTKEAMRYRRLYKDYEKYMMQNNVIFEGNEGLMAEFKTSKYMRAFHDVFHSGTQKDISRWYTLALLTKANDFYHKGIGSDGMLKIRTVPEAFKEAIKSMKSSLTKLNPNKAILKSGKDKKQANKRNIQFLQWLGREDFRNLKAKNPNVSDKELWNHVFKTSKDVKKLGKLQSEYSYKVNLLEKNILKEFEKSNLIKLMKSFNIPLKSLVI